MKNLLIFTTVCSLVLLSGCTVKRDNQATAFMMDTVVNIKAEADSDTLSGALSLCREYEKMFSRTYSGGEIYTLNEKGSGELSDEAAEVINLALSYCEKTGGKFDIAVCPAIELWNRGSSVLPDDKALFAVLPQIDYRKIEINGNKINLNGTRIDLGAVAKGYIADKAREYLSKRGVQNAIIDMGGNLVLMGEEYQNIGIKNPLGEGVAATLKVKQTAVVTSGTYERYITVNGKRYHHILNPETGYPVESDLVSATVINENSAEADVLSTCCLILGLDNARKLIDMLPDSEAVFITIDGKVHTSSGIYSEDGYFRL